MIRSVEHMEINDLHQRGTEHATYQQLYEQACSLGQSPQRNQEIARLCYRIAHNKRAWLKGDCSQLDDAALDDVDQEITMRIVKMHEDHEGPLLESFISYTTVALKRRARRLNARAGREISLPEDPIEDVRTGLSDDRSRAEVILIDTISDVLLYMPQRLSSPLLMRLRDRLPERVIAEKLGITQSAVSKRVTKGLSKLRQRVRQHAREDKKITAALESYLQV